MRSMFLLVLVCCIPLRAIAQDEPGDDILDAETRARAAFNSGTVFFDAGDYESALRDFQTAYDASGRPELLWNIALCNERLSRYEEAVAALQVYGAAGAPGQDVATVQEHLDELHRLIEERGPLPEPEPDAAVAPLPTVDTTPYVAIAGFSVATVGVIGFAIFGPLLLVEDGALATECSPACSPMRVGTLELYGLLSDISLGVALAGAVVGVIGLIVAPSQPSPSEPAVALTPWFARDGAGLGLGGTF